MALITKKCEKCEYYNSYGEILKFCDYCDRERHKRPCPAGDECTVFTPKKKRKSTFRKTIEKDIILG